MRYLAVDITHERRIIRVDVGSQRGDLTEERGDIPKVDSVDDRSSSSTV